MADSVHYYWHIDASGHILAMPVSAPKLAFGLRAGMDRFRLIFFSFSLDLNFV